MSESILPMFSSRSFIVSGLTLRSLIHFEFIFVYGVRNCSINLHSYQECIRIPFSLHSLFNTLYLLLYFHFSLFDNSILTGVRWYLVVIGFGFYFPNDVQHFIINLLVFVYLLWRNVISGPLPIFNKIIWFWLCSWVIGIPLTF